MSAPIHSLLADELDISDEKAEKLLHAMLREVRKRARSGGVRLPEFGTFRERKGHITFEPSDSLARAVNHRFEGLATEDLASAIQEEEKESNESDGGPSTITLGYQASDWSPLDSSESDGPDSKSSPSGEQEASESDTEEFHVPSTEETTDVSQHSSSPPPQDTPESSETEPPSATSEANRQKDSSGADTEELYPLIEDVPGNSSKSRDTDEPSADRAPSAPDEHESTEEDEERESLGRIWNSDVPLHKRTEAASSSEEDASTSPSSDISQDPALSSSETTPTEGRSKPGSPPSKQEPVPETSDQSALPRVLTTVLLVLLLGGGGWYILGETGAVPPLGPSVALVSQQVQSQLGMTTPSTGETSATEDIPSSTAPETEPAGTASSENGPASSTSVPSSDGSTSEQSSSDSGVDPSAGGWTIIVGSRTQRSPAQALQAKFRQQFSDQELSVDILQGQSGNATRYRVAVGQFSSREDAQQFLSQHEDELPEGAWPLSLQ